MRIRLLDQLLAKLLQKLFARLATLEARNMPDASARVASAPQTPLDKQLLLVDAMLQFGRHTEAGEQLRALQAQYGDDWRLDFRLASIEATAGRLDVSVEILQSIVAEHPDYYEVAGWPEVHWQLGLILIQSKRYAEAAATFRELTVMAPALPDAIGQLAVSLELNGQDEEAAAAYRQAIEHTAGSGSPIARQAAQKLVNLHRRRHEWREALRATEDLHAQDPDNAQNLLERALLTLKLGDYAQGWARLEEALPRIDDPHNPEGAQYLRRYLGTQRYWDGSDPGERSLLLWSEHGLGDAIMMARFIPLIRQRFPRCRISLLVADPLLRLFAGFGADRLIPVSEWNSVYPDSFDLHCSLMSLPHRLQIFSEAAIPASLPYLLTTAPRAQAQPGAALKVGIVWAGNPNKQDDNLRSLPLRSFAPLFELPGVQWISLQKGEPARELDTSLPINADGISGCADMLDTAHLICGLDLVITVDTSVVHLAAALGCRTWLLNRHGSEWRWLLDREDSPWYPCLRIFNQRTAGDWSPTIAALRGALGELLASR